MAVVHPSVQVPAGLQLVEGEDVGYDQFRSVIEDPNTTIAGETTLEMLSSSLLLVPKSLVAPPPHVPGPSLGWARGWGACSLAHSSGVA